MATIPNRAQFRERTVYHAGPLRGVRSPGGVSCHHLYANGFVTGSIGTIRQVALLVQGVQPAGTYARVAFYARTAVGNDYPAALLFDAGSFEAVTTGIKTNSISYTFSADALVYACVRFNGATTVALANPTLWPAPLGGDALGTHAMGFRIAPWSYAAADLWPATFPSGATPNETTNAPLVFLLPAT